MIEKLKEHDVIDPKTDKVIGKIGCDLREITDKLNELVDAVNALVYEHDKDSDWYDGQTRPENVLTKSLRMDKEFAEEECKRLQDELDRTRKTLNRAKLILKNLLPNLDGYERLDVEKAIKEITALEQKDVK